MQSCKRADASSVVFRFHLLLSSSWLPIVSYRYSASVLQERQSVKGIAQRQRPNLNSETFKSVAILENVTKFADATLEVCESRDLDDAGCGARLGLAALLHARRGARGRESVRASAAGCAASRTEQLWSRASPQTRGV